MKKPESGKIKAFQRKVWTYYKKNGRHTLPWRPYSRGLRTAKKNLDPYRILVSEMMLQQTQVDRVIPKYKAFLKKFPTVRSLARAPLAEVLSAWNGLGYNRRALFLKRAAERLVSVYDGQVPKDVSMLETLPGVGPYTARAIETFSYNAPYIFVETNIRSVFISEFFSKAKKVSDKRLLPLIEASLDMKRPRDWYYALMDYGVFVKKTKSNPGRISARYAKQSKFKGSLREMRGAILRQCLAGVQLRQNDILGGSATKDGRALAKSGFESLVREGFLDIDSKGYVKIKKG